MDYRYVRIDTNGQFKPELLLKMDFRKLDEITFSLDGPNSEIDYPNKSAFEKRISKRFSN